MSARRDRQHMSRRLIALAATALAALLCAPTAVADPGSDLANLMPRGYTGEMCHAFDAPGAVMAVNCEAVQAGPDRGVFVLLDSPDRSNRHFENIWAGSADQSFSAAACPGMDAIGSAQWPGGRMGCGTVQDAAVIVYTNGPMVAMLRGSDLGALFDWWKSAAL